MKDLSFIKNNLFAHRGLHTLDRKVPENSLLSYLKAMDKGYGIELDINVLKDGNVICLHDNNFRRMCNINKNVNEVNYEDIKDYKLYNTNESIPLLKEALKLINGKVPLLIELKPFGNYKLLCEKFIETMKDYKGIYAIHSFNPFVLKWFKKYYPNIIRGQISEYFKKDKMNFIQKFVLKHMFFNFITKPDFINYGIHDIPNKMLDKYQRKGVMVICYAARSQKELDLAKKYYSNAVFEFFIPET